MFKKELKPFYEMYKGSYEVLKLVFNELYDLGKVVKDLKDGGVYIPPEYNLIDIDTDKYSTFCGKHVIVKTNLGERIITFLPNRYFNYQEPCIFEKTTDIVYELDANGYVYTPYKYSSAQPVKCLEFKDIFKLTFYVEERPFRKNTYITKVNLESKLSAKEIIGAVEELFDIYEKIINFLSENDLFMYNYEKRNDVLLGIQGLI